MRHIHTLLSTSAMMGMFAPASICSMSNYDDGIEHWPATFYGPPAHEGEEPQSAVFEGPLEVPEGWHDHPRKVGDPKAKTEIPGYEEAVAAAEAGEDDGEDGEDGEQKLNADGVDPTEPGVKNTGEDDLDKHIAEKADEKAAEAFQLPPVDKITKKEIIDRLNTIKPKLSFNTNWNEQRLYDLLKDNLDKLEPPAGGLRPVAEGNKL